MDFHLVAPAEAIDRSCGVCKLQVTPRDSVFVAVDGGLGEDGRGVEVAVEHAVCHVSIERARSKVFLEAAKMVRHNGQPDVAVGLEHRAVQIETRIQARGARA